MRAPDPTDPVLVAALRTPIGTAGHGLAALGAVALAAPVVAEITRRTHPLNLPVTHLILGNCLGPGGNVARSAALAGGLPVSTPAITVDRQCGSGLDAVALAATAVRAAAMTQDPQPLILAGGAESASAAGFPDRYTRAPFAPAGFPDPEMGPAAEDLARRLGLTRARQDDYAARSHQRARLAQGAGRFDGEIVPVGGLDRDERPRDITLARLARLPAAFAGDAGDRAEPSAGAVSAGSATAGSPTAGSVTAGSPTAGSVTAGNSSGISDGAAMVAVTTRAAAERAGIPAVAIRAFAVTAGDTALPGAAAGPAAMAALDRAGLEASDIDVVEVTEAFAAVALAFADQLAIDERALCADGGAIALGHPWGASGAILLVRLMSQMLLGAGRRFGLAACAIGGGQGVAMVLERTETPGAASRQRGTNPAAI